MLLIRLPLRLLLHSLPLRLLLVARLPSIDTMPLSSAFAVLGRRLPRLPLTLILRRIYDPGIILLAIVGVP